jgi:glycosyltransferase involved in cell wall biosynthesis
MTVQRRDSRLRVLCLDIEGGHGGSSRSLYQLLRHIDLSAVDVEVWCRRAGLADAYSDLGVSCNIEPTMPKATSVARLSRNCVVYARAALQFAKARPFIARLVDVGNSVDVVHFNIEPLWLLAWSVRQRLAAAKTFHVRTNLVDTAFSRRQMRTIDNLSNDLIFITENERDTFFARSGTRERGHIVHNSVDPALINAPVHAALTHEPRLKIACLSNYSYDRGIDRLVDLACQLKGQLNVVFVVAGDMTLPRSAPGRLGQIGARGGTLADYAKERGVDGSFIFLGHIKAPETVLAGADLLIKPTREYNPWGRDILEALAAQVPVISIGSYSKFVEDGVTGVLHPEFVASRIAASITALAESPQKRATMGVAARNRVLSLCSGAEAAARVTNIWSDAARGV